MSPRLTLGMLLGQMMIVKSPVPPPRQLHNAPLNLLLDLMCRRPTPVAMHYPGAPTFTNRALIR